MNTPVKNLLLVDDDVEDQDIFRHAISEINPGINFTTLSSGSAALEHLQTAADLPDIIFMDINMPLLNGIETLKEMRRSESLKQIPVVLYSTAIRPDADKQSFESDTVRLLAKPPGYAELCSLLATIL